jgi:hypothetical protein
MIYKETGSERVFLYILGGLALVPVTGSFVPLLIFTIVLMAGHMITTDL